MKSFELRETPSNLQVRRALATVTRCMGESEIVLGIEAVFDQRIDVVDVKLSFVQYQIDRLGANEAISSLASQEFAFQR